MRGGWSATLKRWVFLVCLLTQALVVTAPIWHHHHDSGDDDQCAVCAAVSTSQRVTAPTTPGPVLLVSDSVVGILVVDAQADSSALVDRSAMARGPPIVL